MNDSSQDRVGSEGRRGFLSRSWKLVAGLVLATGAFVGYKMITRTQLVRKKVVLDANALATIEEQGVVLDNDVVYVAESGELRVFSRVCTYLGCKVELRDGDLVCPCHGSRFDLRGAPENGPATAPLNSIEVQGQVGGERWVEFDVEG